MAKFIEKIHLVLADLLGKNIATAQDPDKIDRVLELIIVDLFNKYLDHYAKTKKIESFLSHFIRTKALTVSGGLAELPPDYSLYSEVYMADGKTLVTILEAKFWSDRVNSKMDPPTAERPIGRITTPEAETPVMKLQIVPSTNVTQAQMIYFKVPATPKYAYVENGVRYEYDDTNSVDVEFPIGMYPDIINRLLSAFGVVLREGQLSQIMEVFKTQEQAK